MNLKSTTCLWAVLSFAALAADPNDKPSPVHYKSSTAPARSQNKSVSAVNAAALESSRNRVGESSNTQQPQRSELPAAKMVDGIQTGIACFYGLKPLDPNGVKPEPDGQELRAAHASIPLGSRVQVTNTVNGRSVKVTITDRIAPGAERIISVSRPAAERLGFVSAGTAQVKLELIGELPRP
jgi:rare lipoprotein A